MSETIKKTLLNLLGGEFTPVLEKNSDLIVEFFEKDGCGLTCGSLLITVSVIKEGREKIKLYEFMIMLLHPIRCQGDYPIPVLLTKPQNVANKDYATFWQSINKVVVETHQGTRQKYIMAV